VTKDNIMQISRRGQIDPFLVMEVMRAADARAATGADVLHLEVGQPSTQAPASVLRAAHAALDADKLGYTDAFGLPELREKLAGHYKATYGVTVDPARICPTVGSSGGFLLAFLAAFDAGARVALASPGYPAYRNILSALGIEVVEILTGPESGFHPTVEQLSAVQPLDGVIVASPANPTGTVLSREALGALLSWCRNHGVRLVSDEIYHGLTYTGAATCALELPESGGERAIIVNSFSKYFSMTGWRLGWLILPEDLVRSVECLAQNFFISAPTLAQRAALGAFEATEELEANRQRYARNRAILLEELPKAGFSQFAPADGAFYLYADVGHLTNDSVAFCQRILMETGVAITPGVDFDPQRGSSTVRFSFAGSEDAMRESARRLIEWSQQR